MTAKASLLPIAFAAALLAAGNAQALTQDEIANYKGADRQKVLEEGAKKEGKVTFYTSLIVDQVVIPIQNAFQKKYPGVKLEYYRAETTELMQRLLAEGRARNVYGDVVVANLAEAYKKAGLAQSFNSPLMSEYPANYVDPDRTWIAIRTQWSGLAWNTKMVSEADAPKTWEDLLNPKWKSKMVWSSSNTTGGPRLIAHWKKMWGEEKGMEFVKKLVAQDVRTLPGSIRTILDQVIAGEAPLGLSMDFTHIAISKAAGAPITGGSPDPVLTRTGTMHVIKGAPHPHAAMLLADFLMDKDGGQQVLREANYNPAHPAIEAGDAMNWLVPRRNGKTELLMDPVEEEARALEGAEIYKNLFRK
jgi:iron(III) transport system substrate-binding protein